MPIHGKIFLDVTVLQSTVATGPRILLVEGYQVIPSYENTIWFGVVAPFALPPAIHTYPFQVIDHVNDKILPVVSDAVQFLPSAEYPNTFVALPPAIQTDPFQAKALQKFENIEFVDTVQLIPSCEYAN